MLASRFSDSMTRPTATHSTFAGVRVLGRVLVSLRAMSFGSVSRWNRFASKQIHLPSNSFKMVGPDTCAIPTKMIPFKSWWGIAFQELMSTNLSTNRLKVELAVPISSTADPDGTAVRSARINVRPKAFEWSKIPSHRGFLLGVMRQAVYAALPLSIVAGGNSDNDLWAAPVHA